MDVAAPEYPGYGLYDDDDPSEKTILSDSILFIKYCTQTLGYKEEEITIIGRSLGTGVAIYLGTMFPKLKAIVLISAFLSIRYVGEYLAGRALSKILPDVFRNEDFISRVKCPVLLIHGIKDTVVPWTASQVLFDKCKSTKSIHLSALMEHNQLDSKNDLFLPIFKFFYEKLNMEQYSLENGSKGCRKLFLLREMDEFPILAFPFITAQDDKEEESSALTRRTYESNVATDGEVRITDI